MPFNHVDNSGQSYSQKYIGSNEKTMPSANQRMELQKQLKENNKQTPQNPEIKNERLVQELNNTIS